MDFLNKLLSKLPFNGSKTAIGMLSLVLATVLAKYLPQDQATEIAAQTLEKFGWLIGVIGLTHKAVK